MGDGASGGDHLQATSRSRTRTSNESKPSPQVVRALTDFKMLAVGRFPELKGQLYNELNKLRQGDFSDRSVMGIYSPSQKKIVISNKIQSNAEEVRDTVAHELGHALSIISPRGFRSINDTFTRAFRSYRRTHRTASEKSFARSISNYAASSREEAFAEAFSDYFRNGSNAREASKLMMEHWRKKR